MCATELMTAPCRWYGGELLDTDVTLLSAIFLCIGTLPVVQFLFWKKFLS
jgi:hypothetical protein